MSRRYWKQNEIEEFKTEFRSISGYPEK